MSEQIEVIEIRQQLKTSGLTLKENIHSYTDLLQDISCYINHLVADDFNKLIAILYRIDVREELLHELLKQQPNELASNSIAKLIIDRQQKKLQMKTTFNKDENISEDEKW